MKNLEEQTAKQLIEELSNIGNELKKINENLSKPEKNPADRQIINDLIESDLPEETREFILLILENPTLPIFPLVDQECVGDVSENPHTYWLSKIGRSEVKDYKAHKAIIVYIKPA